MRGRRAFERGDDDAALENLACLARHGVEYADVYYMIGLVLERRDDLEGALESMRRAVRINPSYVEALVALASLYERSGDFDQSQGYATRASQLAKPAAGHLDPTTRSKLANQQAALADALAQAGEKRDAIEEYRRALDRCPTFHDIRHRLGITLRDAGLPHQAAQEFRRILRVRPRMLDSQVQLGLTYYSMGRTSEAIQEWEAVLEMEPSRDEARMYLRLVRGASRQTGLPSVSAGARRESTSEGREAVGHDRPSDAPKASDRKKPDDDLDLSDWTTPSITSYRGDPRP